jgi:hypothetical protein
MSGGSQKRQPLCLNPNETAMRLKILIGASGAVTSTTGYGAVSVAKNTTGTYDITLDRKWPAVQYIDGSVQRASGATLHPRLAATYDPASVGTTLQFLTVIAAGTATEPSSGDVIYLTVIFDDFGL